MSWTSANLDSFKTCGSSSGTQDCSKSQSCTCAYSAGWFWSQTRLGAGCASLAWDRWRTLRGPSGCLCCCWRNVLWLGGSRTYLVRRCVFRGRDWSRAASLARSRCRWSEPDFLRFNRIFLADFPIWIHHFTISTARGNFSLARCLCRLQLSTRSSTLRFFRAAGWRLPDSWVTPEPGSAESNGARMPPFHSFLSPNSEMKWRRNSSRWFLLAAQTETVSIDPAFATKRCRTRFVSGERWWSPSSCSFGATWRCRLIALRAGPATTLELFYAMM